jgi:hypothetical protein
METIFEENKIFLLLNFDEGQRFQELKEIITGPNSSSHVGFLYGVTFPWLSLNFRLPFIISLTKLPVEAIRVFFLIQRFVFEPVDQTSVSSCLYTAESKNVLW